MTPKASYQTFQELFQAVEHCIKSNHQPAEEVLRAWARLSSAYGGADRGAAERVLLWIQSLRAGKGTSQCAKTIIEKASRVGPSCIVSHGMQIPVSSPPVVDSRRWAFRPAGKPLISEKNLKWFDRRVSATKRATPENFVTGTEASSSAPVKQAVSLVALLLLSSARFFMAQDQPPTPTLTLI